MRGNTPERWGSVAIGLHWTTAALILLVQLPLAWMMDGNARGPLQALIFAVHKNAGILVFVLAVMRVLWRWRQPVPLLPAHMPAWQAWSARVTHWLLYFIIFAMPISGYLMTAAQGYPVPLLGVADIGPLVAKNKTLGDAMEFVHHAGGTVLYVIAGLHVLGALYHHFVRRDGILRRMLSSETPTPAQPLSQ